MRAARKGAGLGWVGHGRPLGEQGEDARGGCNSRLPLVEEPAQLTHRPERLPREEQHTHQRPGCKLACRRCPGS